MRNVVTNFSKLWDLRNLRRLYNMAGHSEGITAIHFHGAQPESSASSLVTAARDGTVRRWVLQPGGATSTVLLDAGQAVTALALGGR